MVFEDVGCGVEHVAQVHALAFLDAFDDVGAEADAAPVFDEVGFFVAECEFAWVDGKLFDKGFAVVEWVVEGEPGQKAIGSSVFMVV